MKVYTKKAWEKTARRRFGRVPNWAFRCPKCKATRTVYDAVQADEGSPGAYTYCPSCGYTAAEDGKSDIVHTEPGKRMAVFPLAPAPRRAKA